MKCWVSIVIVTFNELSATKRCLNSIRECTEGDYELVVVDNASSDGTREYLRKDGLGKIVFNRENVGFARGVNQGIRLSEGRHILLLNNDTVVTPDWLNKMVACLESNAEFAFVGPLTNDWFMGPQFFWPAWLSYVDYDHFEKTFGPVFRGRHTPLLRVGRYRNEAELREFADEFFPPLRPLSPRQVNYITGFCVLMRRGWADELGGLDERFENGCEDEDFNIRTLLAGRKIVVADNVFVHHDGGKTFAGLGIDRAGSRLKKNRKLLKQKWEKVPRARKIIEEYASTAWNGWIRKSPT